MSTEPDTSEALNTKSHGKGRIRSDKGGEKKRKRDGHTEADRSLSKKSRAETPSNNNGIVEQSQTLPDSIEASSFHTQTSSLYLPLSPISQLHPLKGICAEHLSPLILTYYPPFHGVVLSYSNVHLSEHPSTSAPGNTLARSVDEYAASFVWVTADFLILEPQRGGWIEGWINLQNEGHLGLVCWNLFNASIERKWLPKSWKWIGAGMAPGQDKRSKKLGNTVEESTSQEADADGANEGQGYFEDGYGNKIEGAIRFRVRDIESSQASDKEKGFLSIEGALLSEQEEEDLLAQESARVRGKGKKASGRPDGSSNVMAGALPAGHVNGNSEAIDTVRRKKSKHRVAY